MPVHRPLDRNLAQLDWSLIQSFVAVVAAGNLTRAASLLHTTQPTVGRHIRRLETEMGEILFDRLSGGLRPTARALELYERARAVEEAVTGLRSSLASQSPSVVGTVKVAASIAFAVEVLPRILAPLVLENPGLLIELVADDRIANLIRRDADVAVRLARPTQPDLVATKVCHIDIGLYAHRDYLDRRPAPSTIAELREHDLVGSDDPATTIEVARQFGGQLDHGQVRFRSDTFLAQNAAIVAGMGIGPFHTYLADRMPGLVRVLPEITVAVLPVWIVAHEDVRRSHRIRMVFNHLQQHLRRLNG